MTGRPRPIWAEMLIRSWRLDKGTTALVVSLIISQVVALAMTGVALRVVVDDAAGAGTQLLVAAAVAALGLGLGWIGSYALLMLRSDLADRIGYLQIDPEVQRLAAEFEELEHLADAEYANRLGLLAGKGQVLADAGWGVLETGALAGQIAVTLGVLATVHPVLLALGLFVVPGALLGRAGNRELRSATLAAAEPARVERHLHELMTKAASGKEIRVYGTADALIGKAADFWAQATALQLRARARAALRAAVSVAIFIVGYVAALAYVVVLVSEHARPVADVVLVVTLAGQLRSNFGYAVRKYTQVQAGLALAEPYRWLRGHAVRRPHATPRTMPARLHDGIDLRQVTFRYPGTDRPVLGPLDVHLPAGAMVALVGEHGSGKTTLVKLLCKLSTSSSGQITVDGVPLADIDTTTWWTATAAAFQDFDRHQVRMRHAVGFGDLAAADDDERLMAALRQADAEELCDALPQGLDTQLGVLAEDGHELSEGQWQKIALARVCMRTDPLLVVLDEPTAALDPPSEYAIFQRHAWLARRLGDRLGTITVVVSHRFSTVRMADLILVLDQGLVVEQGDHEELMARNGVYAGLYRLQETAYRM